MASKPSLQSTIFCLISRVSAGTIINITIPNQIQVAARSGTNMTTCVQQVQTLPTNFVNQTGACLYTKGSSNQFVTYTVPSDQVGIFKFTLFLGPLTNPNSILIPDSFIVSYQGTPSGVINTDLAIQCQGGIITGANITTLSGQSIQAAAFDTYTFNFKVQNNIPKNGQIGILFPPSNYTSLIQIWQSLGLSVSVYSQTATGGKINFNQLTNTLLIQQFLSSDLTAQPNKSISITISGLQNPAGLGLTSSFQICSLDSQGKVIDLSTVNLQLQISNPALVILNQFSISSMTVDSPFFLQLDLTPPVVYDQGGQIEIVGSSPQLTSKALTTTCTKLLGFNQPSSACTISMFSSNTVVFPASLNPSYPNQQMIIYSFTNPLGVMSIPSFQINYRNSQGLVVATLNNGINYTTQAGNCYVQSALRKGNLGVGSIQAIFTLQFYCDHRIRSTGVVQMLIPVQQMAYNSKMTCSVVGQATTIIPCQVTLARGGNYVNVTAYQWVQKNGADFISSAQNPLSIQLNGQNPFAIAPISAVPSIEISTLNSLIDGSQTYYLVDKITSGVFFSGDLIPGKITSLVASKIPNSPDYQLTGGVSQYSFSLTSATAIPQNGYISITFPILVAYFGQSGLTCTSSSSSTPVCTATEDANDSTQIRKVSWSNVCSTVDGGCPSRQVFILQVSGIQNSFSTFAPNTTFQVETFTSDGYLIDAGQVNVQVWVISLSPNAMKASLLSPVSPIVTGYYDTYIFQIANPNNNIPAVNGSIVISIPVETAFYFDAKCEAATQDFDLNCLINGTIINVTSSQDIAINSVITVSISEGIMNPQTTKPSSPFTISTFFNGIYAIDVANTINVASDTPNQIYNVTAVRSKQTQQIDISIKVCFQTTNPISIGAKILFLIPLDQALISPFVSQKPAPTPVKYSATHSLVQINEQCSNGKSPCPSGVPYCTILNGFSNLASSLSPSSSVSISVMTSDGYLIDEISEGVVTTPYISEAPLTISLVNRTSSIVGDTVGYTIQFTADRANANMESAIFTKAIITFPHNLLFWDGNYNVECTVKNVASNESLITDCDIENYYENELGYGQYISIMSVNLQCEQQSISCVNNAQIRLTIAGASLLNPYSTQIFSGGVISVATEYQMDDTYSTKNYGNISLDSMAAFQSLKPNYISVVSLNRNVETVDANVGITFEIITQNRLIKNSTFVLFVPTSQFVLNGQPLVFRYQQEDQFVVANITLVSSNSTYTVLQFTEWCATANGYCPDQYYMLFVIAFGFKNVRFTGPPSSYIMIKTLTPSSFVVDSTWLSDALEADPVPQPALLNIQNVLLNSNFVGQSGVSLLLSFIYGATINSTDSMVITFSDEFVRSDAGIIKNCFDLTGQVSKICSNVSSQNVIQQISLASICSSPICSSSSIYNISISNLVNILQQQDFSGTLSVELLTQSGSLISQGQFDLTQYPTLVSGSLSNPSVTRSTSNQGMNASFDFSFSTPPNSYLLPNSTVQLLIPTDQVVLSPDTKYLVSYGKKLQFYSQIDTSMSTNDMNVVSFPYWSCKTGSCSTVQQVKFTILNAANPFTVSPLGIQSSFQFSFYSSDSNLIFQSTSSIVALPQLTLSKFSSIQIQQSISSKASLPTGFNFIIQTSAGMVSNGQIQIVFPPNKVVQENSTLTQCTINSNIYSVTSNWNASSTSTTLSLLIMGICPDSQYCQAQTYIISCQGGMLNPSVIPKKSSYSYYIYFTDSAGLIIEQGQFLDSKVKKLAQSYFQVASKEF